MLPGTDNSSTDGIEGEAKMLPLFFVTPRRATSFHRGCGNRRGRRFHSVAQHGAWLSSVPRRGRERSDLCI